MCTMEMTPGDERGGRDIEQTCMDVIVGYVSAQHRSALDSWQVRAVRVDARTVALRARSTMPAAAAGAFPLYVLRDMADRIAHHVAAVTRVVPDVTTVPPDVTGSLAISA